MKITRKTLIVFALICVCVATAYSQDCSSYLKQAAELVSQKNYCDALSFYRKYRDCNADADVSTEIAMCEKRCKLDGGNPQPDNSTKQGNTISTDNRTVMNSTSSNRSAVIESAPSSMANVNTNAKFKLGLNGGLLYPMEKVEGTKTYLYFGGVISGEYLATPNIGLGINAGYYGYEVKIKKEDVVVAKVTPSLIPINLTGKYYFLTKSIQPYAGVEVGYYTIRDKEEYPDYPEENVSGSVSKFGLAPIVGFQFKLSNTLALDVNAKYNIIFGEGGSAKLLGLNVGIVYAFGK